jgi:hypothetical protein
MQPRLSFNHLAVSDCTVAGAPLDQLGGGGLVAHSASLTIMVVLAPSPER